MGDVFLDPPPTYYDDEERFGTGSEMIAEIRRLRERNAELEDAVDKMKEGLHAIWNHKRRV